ncbi:MAG TPA: hypothetical protein VMM60_09990 [Ilumatobacter sp.]|nr:hypothetical protein [Ilumatobacter sp.]
MAAADNTASAHNPSNAAAHRQRLSFGGSVAGSSKVLGFLVARVMSGGTRETFIGARFKIP